METKHYVAVEYMKPKVEFSQIELFEDIDSAREFIKLLEYPLSLFVAEIYLNSLNGNSTNYKWIKRETIETFNLNFLKKERFLTWYFSDGQDYKEMGFRVSRDLLRNGEFKITTEMLFKDVNFIPVYICENDFSDKVEYLPDINITLID